jgi:hypothetical protein
MMNVGVVLRFRGEPLGKIEGVCVKHVFAAYPRKGDVETSCMILLRRSGSSRDKMASYGNSAELGLNQKPFEG